MFFSGIASDYLTKLGCCQNIYFVIVIQYYYIIVYYSVAWLSSASISIQSVVMCPVWICMRCMPYVVGVSVHIPCILISWYWKPLSSFRGYPDTESKPPSGEIKILDSMYIISGSYDVRAGAMVLKPYLLLSRLRSHMVKPLIKDGKYMYSILLMLQSIYRAVNLSVLLIYDTSI